MSTLSARCTCVYSITLCHIAFELQAPHLCLRARGKGEGSHRMGKAWPQLAEHSKQVCMFCRERAAQPLVQPMVQPGVIYGIRQRSACDG